MVEMSMQGSQPEKVHSGSGWKKHIVLKSAPFVCGFSVMDNKLGGYSEGIQL